MNRLFAIIILGALLMIGACAEDSAKDDPWQQAVQSYEDKSSEKSAQIIFQQIDPDPWRQSTKVNLEERMNTAYEAAKEQGLKEEARQYLLALTLFTNSDSRRSVYLKKLTELYDTSDEEHRISYYINQAMGDKPGSLDSSINRLGKNLYDSSKHRMNKRKANQFIDACEAYALTHPNDDQSAKYLHSAAVTARSLEQYDRSIFYYHWIYNEYPNSEKRPYALFLTGFTYDDDLGMMDSARVYYDSFINTYPKHELKDDAQFLIDNLGKSEDEIKKMFEKQKGQQQ